ncbi:MAG: NAD+ synthase [Gemmatimonadetes bacterium]|nr:NAD+ synthase [Gemmatimonadota bacterium]
MARLRIGLAQINATVGDLEGNASKVAAMIDGARDGGVQFLAFPELCVSGYPPEDLLLKPAFVDACRRTVERLANRTHGLTAVVGFPERASDLHNAAAVLHDGSWAATIRKQRLPNYGVFDELRYFKPGAEERIFFAGGAWVGVSICEDIWLPDGPVARMAAAGADVIVNINASPYHRGKWRERQRMLATRAADYGVAIAYVNLIGGQDELVFDGGSLVIDPMGEIVAESEMFEEALLICDVELEQVFRARLHDPRRRHEVMRVPRSVERSVLSSAMQSATTPMVRRDGPVHHDDVEEAYRALVLGTRDYVRKNGFRSVVLGLSGGIDSSLVAVIAVDALGADAVTCVSMPSRFSSEGSRVDACALAKTLGIRFLSIPIEPVHASLLDVLAGTFEGCRQDMTEENLQARVRGTLLMALSNKFGWLLLTTGNKSELATGYTTLYGDMAGGFAVIRDVPKTLVYALARWRNQQSERAPIPLSVLEKPPSAELRPDQKDSDSLPPYDVLDPILELYVEDDRSIPEIVDAGFDETIVRRVAMLVDGSEYKRRQAPPGVKITPRAFGKDRRLPITNAYRDGAPG